MTIDGYPGVVADVVDGPYPGTERYSIILDNALGGGDYDSGEITENLGASNAMRVSRTAARADLPLLEPDEAIAAGLNLASVDYPELADILYERPDWVEVEPASPTLRLSKAAKLAAPIDPVWNKPKGDPIGESLTDPDQPGWWRKIVGPALDRMNQALPPEHQVTDINAIPAIQWCRFRRDGYCYFPDHIDAKGTKEAGYAVWTPVNQGICPRRSHKTQKDCPVSEPGPDSGESVKYPDATISWAQGGQRRNRSYAVLSEVVKAEPVELTTKARRYSDVPLVCDRCGSSAVTSIAGGKEGHTMLCPDCMGTPMPAVTAKISKWSDLVTKARNIYRLGWVRVISVTPLKETNIPWHKGEEVGVVTAEVRGDNAIYLSSIIREPGSKRVGMWECSCPWASYSWARTRQWKKYEGRMCSHVLALLYEAQAQEMFSDFAGIQEDAETPVWRDQEPTFYTPPDRVSYILTAQNLVGHLATVEHPQRDVLLDKARTSLHMAANVGIGHIGTFRDVKVKIRNQIINLLDIIDAGHAIVEEFGEVAVDEILYPTTGDLNQGLRYSGAKTAQDDSSNGVMIALVPSIDMRAFIHTLGIGHDIDLEPPEGIHLTVAYLGKTDQIDRETFNNIVRTTAQDFEPLLGKVGGAGVFANDDSNVLWVSADVPGLDLMRAALVSKILDAGIQIPADHGFTPHITVGYSDGPIDVSTDELGQAGIHGAELAFSSLVAAYGGEWTHYSLHGSEAGVLAVEKPATDEIKVAAKPDLIVDGDTMTGPLVIEAKGNDPSGDITGFDRMSRCYELAGRYMIANKGGKLVHGTVNNGTKEIRHAWVVDPDGEIFEPTTGIHYDAASFDAQYSPVERVSYPWDKAAVQMVKFEHWGPWDDEPTYTAALDEPEPESALAERSRTAIERREAEPEPKNSILYDEPQPALPVSYGTEEEDAALLEGLPPEDPAGEEPLKPGDARLAWVMGDYKGEAQDDDDVAAAAEKFLGKEGLKEFTPDEKAALIEEGGDVGASNLSSLDLSGTHYTWDENEDDSLMWAL